MSTPPPIPQTSPKAGYQAQKTALDAALARVMEGGWYILGKELAAFESAFAAYLGLPHALGVANGTDAIELALRALGVGPGQAVFTVSHTAVATVAAIERCGAVPVLVDIEPATYTLDPNRLADRLRRGLPAGLRPAAVVPVHLYGQPADMPALLDLARRHDLRVVEDCAQAHGARLHGTLAGAFADAAAFSFYPTKNLGAFGDGGAVATRDPGLAARVRMLREYGWEQRYISSVPGVNSRLDDLQAALLAVRLTALDADNAGRRRIAAAYDQGLAGTGLGLPAVRPGAEHVYHQYVLRAPRRDAFRDRLQQAGVGTGIHYPVPIHLQPAYRGRLGQPGDLPITEAAAREIVSLPMFPQLSDEQVQQVVAACLAAVRG